MQLTPSSHVLNIPFSVPAPSGPIPRSVNLFLHCDATITLIDSGVAGTEGRLFSYLRTIGRRPEEVARLVLTHSHPDHLGAAGAVRAATGCQVLAHRAERGWIEDTALQERERPVPGFASLVGGPVAVDRELRGGEMLTVGENASLEVLHTPGHSAGSISLWSPAERVLFTGDAVLLPGDLPIFDDYRQAVASVSRLSAYDAEWLLSAWDAPRHGEAVRQRMAESLAWLETIGTTVREVAESGGSGDPLELCRRSVARLGLPPFAVNPLVARSFLSCLAS